MGLEVTLLVSGEASGLAAERGESDELLLGGLHRPNLNRNVHEYSVQCVLLYTCVQHRHVIVYELVWPCLRNRIWQDL